MYRGTVLFQNKIRPHNPASRDTELFIEDQAFSPSYDLAPPPHPLISKLVRRHTGRLGKRDNMLTGRGRGGGGDESNHGEPA
jgi:hypothetical protein